jgi:hypothetical protein
MTEPVRSFSAVDAGTDVDDADLAIPAESALEALRDELADELEGDLITIPVPARPGYELRCATGVRYEQLSAWRKAAADKTKPGGLNELHYAAIILGNVTRGIRRQGEEVVTPDGPLTFASRELHELLGVTRARDAVIKLFGKDGHVVRACRSVLEAAGYGTDDLSAEADPTQLS